MVSVCGHANHTVRRSRYARTRASGLPSTSRSLITATLSAPAPMTAGALSSAMPPIATSGRPAARAALAASAYAVETDRRVVGRLRPRVEHRADREVTYRLTNRGIHLFLCVGRQTDHRRLADEVTNQGWREVVLPDVHAVRSAQPCDIGTVVDDHVRVRPVRQRHDCRRRVEQPFAWRRLRAKLQERGAPTEKRRRHIDHR